MGIYRAGRLPLPSLGGQSLLLLFHAPLLIVLFAQEFPAEGHGVFQQAFVPVCEFEPLSRAAGERMLAPAVRRDDVRAGISAPVGVGEVREDVGGDLPPECGGVRVAAVAPGGLGGVARAWIYPARPVHEAAHGGVGGGRAPSRGRGGAGAVVHAGQCRGRSVTRKCNFKRCPFR